MRGKGLGPELVIRSHELVSISSTFYQQLLHAQIPKAQKKTVNLLVFWALLGSVQTKAAHRMQMK